MRPEGGKIKIAQICSVVLFACAFASGQQTDPITVIKNQIDLMQASDREFDKTFLGMLEKQHIATKEADAYLDSIGWPHMDAEDEHGPYEKVLDFELELDHKYRMMRLKKLEDAVRNAQAGLPLPNHPDASQKIPLLLKMMGAQLATEDEEYAQEKERKQEINEIERLVGACVDASIPLDDSERTKLKSLADSLSRNSPWPAIPVSPEEKDLADDLLSSRGIKIQQKRNAEFWSGKPTNQPSSPQSPNKPDGNGSHGGDWAGNRQKPGPPSTQPHGTPTPHPPDKPHPNPPEPKGPNPHPIRQY